MYRDEFKTRYTTLPFAIYKGDFSSISTEIITHQHREVEVICMLEGSAVFSVQSQSYQIKKGDILIIPPYALHRAHTSNTEATQYYCICFDLSLICDEWLKNGLETQTVRGNDLISGEHSHAKNLRTYIEEAFSVCEKQEKGWEMIAVGNMSLLFGCLKRQGFFFQSEANEKDADFGKRVMQYIISNYSTSITSRDAANELYINHSFFCRSFKKSFGQCFTDYLLAYRTEKAKTYLTHSELSVTEIAFRVGFNDCSYFCRVFKKEVGASPLNYRKRNAAAVK